MRAHFTDRTYTVDQLNSQIEALKQTIYQQNQDLRIYQHNERVLKERLSERMSPKVIEQPVATLPLYEISTKPDPLSIEYQPTPIKPITFGNNKIIPSPIRMNDDLTPNKLSFETYGDRAGVKSKKDCTIDCVFSSRGCEKCNYSKDGFAYLSHK